MKRIVAVSLLCMIVSACFSASLTILVNQRDNSGQMIFENTRIFEDGLINYFFETGTIVSNEPICLEAEYAGAYQSALDASKKGFIDYVAVYNVEIDAANQNIKDIKWKLVQVKTGGILEEGHVTAPSITNKEDIQKGILKFAEQNGIAVLKAMAKKR